MTTYAFLSDEWISKAREARERHPAPRSTDDSPIRMNLVIEQVPFGEGRIEAHLDTTTGYVDIELGHLEQYDVAVSLDYEVAKSILIEGNAETGMQAFMAGRIRVEGDLTKLLEFQSRTPSDEQASIAQEVRALTE